MAGRIATRLLVAFCLLCSAAGSGRAGSQPGRVVPAFGGGSRVENHQAHDAPRTAASWFPKPLTALISRRPKRRADAASVASAGHVRHVPVAGERPIPGVPYYGPDGIVTSGVPREGELPEPSPLEATLYQVFKRSWYRLEYLQWTIDRPGDTFLGAPLDSVIDPTGFFSVFDNQIPANEIGRARVPTLSPIAFRENDGIRGTLGVDLEVGTFEMNVFALDQASDRFQVQNLTPQIEELQAGGLVVLITPGEFAATSLLENGQPSNIVELYNRRFAVSYSSGILGAGANLVLSEVTEFGLPRGLEIQPLVGFRYLLIQEELHQEGVFEDITGAVPLLQSEINSDTHNHLFGPTIGLRTELQQPWFTIGAETKLTLATDAFQARVITNDFRSAADPRVETIDRSVYFSPVGEIQAYARVHVTPNFTLTVGYNLLHAHRITRPHRNILYNDNGPFPTPPGIVVKPDDTDLRIEGLSVGAEIRLP